MTALPGWHRFRWGSSPGDPPRVLIATSPEGTEASLGEVLEHGHGIWTAVLLRPDGSVLLEETVRDELHGLSTLYGWALYHSCGGSWLQQMPCLLGHNEAQASGRSTADPSPAGLALRVEQGVPGAIRESAEGQSSSGVRTRPGQPEQADGAPPVETEQLRSEVAPPHRRRGPVPAPAAGELGLRIRTARDARGWPQRELARRAAPRAWLSCAAALSRLERGETTRSYFLPAILRALGLE